MFTSHLKTVIDSYIGLPNGFCLKSWLRPFSFQGLSLHPLYVTSTNIDKYYTDAI